MVRGERDIIKYINIYMYMIFIMLYLNFILYMKGGGMYLKSLRTFKLCHCLLIICIIL